MSADMTRGLPEGPRQAEPCDPDAHAIRKIVVEFEVPTYVTPEDYRRIDDLVREVVARPENQPVMRSHWLGFHGSRPRFSDRDRQFLGLPGTDPEAPADGEEPTSDHDVTVFATSTKLRDEYICEGCWGGLDEDGECPTPGCEG